MASIASEIGLRSGRSLLSCLPNKRGLFFALGIVAKSSGSNEKALRKRPLMAGCGPKKIDRSRRFLTYAAGSERREIARPSDSGSEARASPIGSPTRTVALRRASIRPLAQPSVAAEGVACEGGPAAHRDSMAGRLGQGAGVRRAGGPLA